MRHTAHVRFEGVSTPQDGASPSRVHDRTSLVSWQPDNCAKRHAKGFEGLFDFVTIPGLMSYERGPLSVSGIRGEQSYVWLELLRPERVPERVCEGGSGVGSPAYRGWIEAGNTAASICYTPTTATNTATVAKKMASRFGLAIS